MLPMPALRSLYESMGFEQVATYLQSGNVVFRTKERNLPRLATRIEEAVEKRFGFRPDVVLRSTSELKEVVGRNPFAKRRDIEPKRLLVMFLEKEPDADGRRQTLALDIAPEEVKIEGKHAYIYYADGMARPKLSWPKAERMLKTTGTGRNWNTVNQLLHMAESIEAS